MKRRLWYIWLGPLAALTLFYLSLHTIDKHEMKLRIGYSAQKILRRKVWRNVCFFGLIVIGVPTVALMLLIELPFGQTENFIFQRLHMIYIYSAGVYTTYRHVRWRDENLSDLLESKKSEAIDDPHEDVVE